MALELLQEPCIGQNLLQPTLKTVAEVGLQGSQS